MAIAIAALPNVLIVKQQKTSVWRYMAIGWSNVLDTS
jgi:hypothetical protein